MKKIIALVLVAIMAMSLLCGCKGNNAGANTAESSSIQFVGPWDDLTDD